MFFYKYTLSFSLLFFFLSLSSPSLSLPATIQIQNVESLTYSFFHISDIHFDPLSDPVVYNTTTFCRPDSEYNGEELEHAEHKNNKIITKLMDVPGEYGRYGCDTPEALFTSALVAMQKVNPHPDFIIFTGDSPAHNLSPENQIYVIQKVVTMLMSYFPNTPVIPAIGNNDVYPDYTVKCADPRLNELYIAYSKFIPDSQSLAFLEMGSFMTYPVSGLRVISLNTILYSIKNSPGTDYDPCNQFSWLEGQLESARQLGDKVYIVGHIIPGMDPDFLMPLWYPVYINIYINLVLQYNDVIYGSFYGHIHRDEFRILNDPDSKKRASAPSSSILAASSISPVYSNNPSFRTFFYNTSFGLLDYYDYYLDLTLANSNGLANWTQEYSFGESYKQSSLSTDDLSSVYSQLQNDAILFSQWYDRRVGQYQASKQTALCVLNSADSGDFQNCLNSD